MEVQVTRMSMSRGCRPVLSSRSDSAPPLRVRGGRASVRQRGNTGGAREWENGLGKREEGGGLGYPSLP
jgi:hypothetical protein